MNILHTLFLLFCVGTIYCSDKQSETLQGQLPLSVKLSDSPVDFPNIINFPAELRLIVVDYADNLKGAYCLFTKEERNGEDNVYYKRVLKKYLEKIVRGIAVQNLQCENYEKDIFKTWKYSLSLVSAHFISTLNYHYKKYMDNSFNVVTYCNAKLFTFKQGLLLKELCPQINIISSEEVDNSDENIMLQAAIITKQDETCTLYRIMDGENFFEYIETHFLNIHIPPAVLFKRVIWFNRLINVIDEQEAPLLCKLIKNKKFEDIPLYSYPFIKTIIDRGADVNVKTLNGHTPLSLCAFSNTTDIATLLIFKGADVNAKTIFGNSALHIAAINNKRDMVELLLEKGAKINAENNDKETPLDEAIRHRNIGIIDLLKKKGASRNIFSDPNPMQHYYSNFILVMPNFDKLVS